MNDFSQLTAISPLDGRYCDKVAELAAHFSEAALMRYRVLVEAEWFIFLCNTVKLREARVLKKNEVGKLRGLYEGFSLADAKNVKAIEAKINHDVKAIEYFVKEKLEKTTMKKLSEFVHFCCTSEDINNLAYALLLKDFHREHFLPKLQEMQVQMLMLVKKWKDIPMLARTHGQPASPTTVGKELFVFATRIAQTVKMLETLPRFGKINGAVGNWNAHVVAYPNIDWKKASKQFVENLGLTWNPVTTQIEPHDHLAMHCSAVAQLNTICIDLCRDMWTYISFDYFKQKMKSGEVGSSTMPHKVNPIDFENAEGNLGIANALFRHFAEKLPISRMQRDLSDSTVFRSIGVAFGHTMLAYKSLLKGLGKIELNEALVRADLASHFEVLAEPIQTILRKHGKTGAYEKLKALTRGKKVTAESLRAFIQALDIPEDDKKRLLALTPERYTGLA